MSKRKAQNAKLFYRIISFFLLFFFLLPIRVWAQGENVRVKYEAEYFLGTKGDARVVFKIKMKNLRSDVYVKKFTLAFPSSFEIDNLEAYGNGDIKLEPKVEEKGDRIVIAVELKNPSIGKGTENNIRLEFLQKKLIRIEGNIWEIILPTVERKGEEVEGYSVKVILPEGGKKKLSLAKPKPDLIQGRTIFWNDVKSKVLYAVFGSPQYYKLDLKYAVENPKLVPVFTYIAFPPETLYQKILIDSISPKPSEVKIDEDGNYLGKYFLKPKERLEVRFKGYAEVFSKPREEFYPVLRKRIEKQRPYLLRETKYWQLGDSVISVSKRNLSSREKARIIFNFVVNKLSYDFNKVSQRKILRLGATKALENPQSAVCTEFTDLFIALARENGILAREVQGFGYSQDRRFRPLSLITDVLHAWPEYYDEERKVWVPVDPTWQDTSGIDYFSSLDFNHIAFVIHGKSDIYPLPAGAYKIEDRKDVSILPVSFIPKEKVVLTASLKTDGILGSNYILQGQKEKLVLTFENKGNSFILGKKINIFTSNLDVEKKELNLDFLAPYQKKQFIFAVKGDKVGEGRLGVEIEGREILSKSIQVKPTWYKYFIFVAQNWLFLSFIFLIILFPLFLFFKAKKVE